MDLNTYFYNEAHEKVASVPGLVTIPKGTMLVLREGSYIVDDVQLHLNSHDTYCENRGFRVFCKENK